MQSFEDLSISTYSDKIVDVCAKEDAMAINCDFLLVHTLFKSNCFATFTSKESAHGSVPCTSC